jgi:quercetin dioxygenase-like cupin family protein
MAQAQPKLQSIPGADPAQVDSKHYQVVLENDRIRVLRISYGPGERSVMHGHPASLALLTTDAQIRFTYPNGRSEDVNATAGGVLWVEAEDHLPENLGRERLEATLVELKTPASLGEQIGDERGNITSMRVIPGAEGQGLKVEVSFQSAGEILGIPATGIGTYSAVTRPDGLLYGEGQGMITTKDGETAIWKGNGVGRPTGRGSAVSWRGAVYYQTSADHLKRLNGVAGIFEHEADENGNTIGRTYEWK